MSDGQTPEPVEISEAISQRLSEAINAVLAEELGGGFLSGFIGLVKYIDADGDNNWSFVAMGDQSLDTSLGMLHIANAITDRQMKEVWGLDRG
jgi:hypothetical protein